MTHHENLKILAFVGLAGSGKSTAVEYLTAKGYPKVYFGGVIFKAMDEAGLAHTQENEKPFREEFRRKYGPNAVADKIIEEIEELTAAGQHRIVADGLYTWSEYKALKKAFPGELIVVAIVAQRRLRYHRLSIRPMRPLTSPEAYARDEAEIENLEKGGPIAIADHYIINNENVDAFYEALDAEVAATGFYE